MALLDCVTPFEDVDTVANAWKTLASLKAPSDQMLSLKRAEWFPNGVAGDAKHLKARMVRITADSGTGTAITPKKLNNAFGCTPRATARWNFTVEPTVGDVLYPSHVHPQGAFAREMTFDGIAVEEGTEVAIQVFMATGETVVKVAGGIYHLE
jgi:hypothetical protein